MFESLRPHTYFGIVVRKHRDTINYTGITYLTGGGYVLVRHNRKQCQSKCRGLRSLHSARTEQDARNKGFCMATARCGSGLRVYCAMFSRALCGLAYWRRKASKMQKYSFIISSRGARNQGCTGL